MVGQGVSRSEREIAQKVVRERCADQGRAGVECRCPGNDLDLDGRIRRPACLEQHFKGRPGHAIHAGISRGNQGHTLSLCCPFQGFNSAVELLGHRFFDDLLAFEQIGDKADIGDIADDGIGFGNSRPGARRQVFLAARAQPDQHDLAGLRHIFNSIHPGILAMETVAFRPSSPRRRCFSTSRCARSTPAPAHSSAAASATEGVPV